MEHSDDERPPLPPAAAGTSSHKRPKKRKRSSTTALPTGAASSIGFPSSTSAGGTSFGFAEAVVEGRDARETLALIPYVGDPTETAAGEQTQGEAGEASSAAHKKREPGTWPSRAADKEVRRITFRVFYYTELDELKNKYMDNGATGVAAYKAYQLRRILNIFNSDHEVWVLERRKSRFNDWLHERVVESTHQLLVWWKKDRTGWDDATIEKSERELRTWAKVVEFNEWLKAMKGDTKKKELPWRKNAIEDCVSKQALFWVQPEHRVESIEHDRAPGQHL